ncbi:sugar ABC transporter substrate-binding protein [Paenibacillus sp. KQZ6P-2]|uniref:Sugar ABC transporter substrate-binding protein n=1 Tax=Paenibacillus mangrovi TaxID=2931978 RepID=A0A9X2B3Q3_9BACL|nr:sugar ABC transporter substrate-binding protein [Paenibacillus mangrovi]MCJ8013666.1 sugar ABC transporter substrate-binding protein [Paenibacillus mangrovi]
MIQDHRVKWRMFILSIIMLIALTGCSSNSKDTTSNDKNMTQTNDQTDVTNKKDVKLVFWHYLNDRDDLLKEMASDFEQKTGIKVDVQLFGGDGFKQKIMASAQNNALPDVMTFAGGAGDLGQLVEAGNVMELSDMKDMFDKFPSTILKTFTFDNNNIFGVKKFGTYAIPMDTNNMQFVYNTKLFEKVGITSAPTTWDELLTDVDRLKAAGIVPFATGIGSWVAGSMAAPYEVAYLGEEKLVNVKKGDESLVDSGYLKVLQRFEDLYKHGAYAEGIATMDLPAAEQMFVNEEVAMIFDGSWAIGVFNQMNPNFTHYDVFQPPKPADAAYDVKIPGGIGVPLVIDNHTKNKEAAMQFVRFLVEKEQQQKYASKSFNLPANIEAATSESGMTPALHNFSLGMNHIIENGGSYPDPSVETVLQKGIQLIAIGQSTPDKVLKEMDVELQKALKEKK